MDKFLNPTGNPGQIFDLDYLNCTIVAIRCCLSDLVSKLAIRARYGALCSDESLEQARLKQLILKYLMCVNFEDLSKECLDQDELVNMINFLKLNCTNCTKC